MRSIVLDGSDWRTKDDFYDAFFSAVGAPAFHGRSLDALADSISGRMMNAVDLPYEIRIFGFQQMGIEAQKTVVAFHDLAVELKRERGDPIEIVIPGLSPH